MRMEPLCNLNNCIREMGKRQKLFRQSCFTFSLRSFIKNLQWNLIQALLNTCRLHCCARLQIFSHFMFAHFSLFSHYEVLLCIMYWERFILAVTVQIIITCKLHCASRECLNSTQCWYAGVQASRLCNIVRVEAFLLHNLLIQRRWWWLCKSEDISLQHIRWSLPNKAINFRFAQKLFVCWIWMGYLQH